MGISCNAVYFKRQNQPKQKMMNRIRSIIFFASLLLMSCSIEKSSGSEQSPYAGQENREIKALSARQINGYLEGRGMGFAIERSVIIQFLPFQQ